MCITTITRYMCNVNLYNICMCIIIKYKTKIGYKTPVIEVNMITTLTISIKSDIMMI